MKWNDNLTLEAALSFQRGEENGFRWFYDELYYQLNYFAFKIVRDQQIAEDMVETVFIKIWERKESFSHPFQIKDWLYTTVKNQCLSFLAKEKLYKKRDVFIQESASLINDGADHDMIRAEIFRQLYFYIDELPSSCKMVMKEFYLEGISVRDIAKKMNTEVSTVKNQKCRGLMLLRKKYNVTKESINAKEYRWVKSIFFNSRNNMRTAKLYGVTDSLIADIRKANIYPKITQQFING